MDADFPEGMTASIAGFLKNQMDVKKGESVYQDVFENGFFFPLQRQAELRWMIRRVRASLPEVAKIVEIGCDKGGGLYHWCKCFHTVRYVGGIEIRGTPYKDDFEAAFPEIEFAWGEGSSRDQKIVNDMRLLGDRPIDVLFIDGDKSAFERDFFAYLPHMNPRGIVFMHDVNDRPPKHSYERVIGRLGLSQEVCVDASDYTVLARRIMEDDVTLKSQLSAHENWLLTWKGQSCGVGVIDLLKWNDKHT